MADIEIQIPAGGVNNARWDLDIHMIPSIFYKDPADFIIRCRREKDGYLCALFNRYYEIANRVFFLDDPKQFGKEQFSLTETAQGKQQLLCLSLPDEHKGSLNYCTGYAITYEKGLFGPKNAKFFTLERYFGGIFRLGTVDSAGNHTDLGEAAGEIAQNFDTIFRAASEMDARRAVEIQAQRRQAKAAAAQKAKEQAARKKIEKRKK